MAIDPRSERRGPLPFRLAMADAFLDRPVVCTQVRTGATGPSVEGSAAAPRSGPVTQAPLRRLGPSLLAVVGILCLGAVALSWRRRRDAVPAQRRSFGAAAPADRPGTGLPPRPDTGPDPMTAPTDLAPHRAPRTLSLALQGGGSFGAFTWGVLDRLLEEDDLVIDAVSSTNAGSVNAVVMAAGLIAGGRPEARRHLDRFWKRISETAPPQLGPAVTVFTDITSRWLSPYQSNPFNHDALDRLLADAVDFDALRAAPPFKLLVAATAVSDGATRIFRETELVRKMVLASGCIPLKSQAVEIEGRRYWDGGYSANPPLIRLIEASDAPAILLVQIVPSLGQGAPCSAPDIVRRLEQITFDGVLQRELSALRTMVDLSWSGGGRIALALHRVSAEDHHPALQDESSTDLGWRFLLRLRAAGRSAAEAWLAEGTRLPAGRAPPLRSIG